MNKKFLSACRILALRTSIFGLTLILFACDSEPINKAPGQALASVDGEEITVSQLNDELNRVKIQADQIDQAKKQLLESMIDRQLMVAEAKHKKLDRAPNVMQAIERAKMQIIAQSYMQTTLSQVDDPTETEISQFYQEHPELFAQRKQYNLAFLRFPSQILNDEFNSVIDSAKSLSDAANWLDKHEISYVRDKIIRAATDIPPQVAAKLQNTKTGEMFLVHENDNANATSMLVFVKSIEKNPATIEAVKQQIAMHLLNNKRRETAQAAISHLRSNANIEYLHDWAETTAMEAIQPSTKPLDTKEAEMPLDDILLQDESIERGIGGLK